MQIIEASGWVRWLLIGGLLVMFCFLVFAAWWSLFSDRSRGRRRCPRCWYDLSWTPGMLCAECGHTARSERELRRVRRRPLIAALSIAGCTAIGLVGLDEVQSRGWMSFVPTWALTHLAPMTDDSRGLVWREIDRRIRADELTDGEWLELIELCADGDGGARPAADAWLVKYGGLAQTARRRVAHHRDRRWRAQANELLLRIPPRVSMDTRDTWPAGVGATVDVEARTWWVAPAQCRIRATADVPGARTAVHVLRDAPIQSRSYSMLLPPLDPGEHEIRIDVAFERRAGPTVPWQPAGTDSIALNLTVEGSFAETLEAVRGPAYDEAVRRAFGTGLVKYTGGGSLPVRVIVDRRATDGPLFRGTAVAVRADVLRNGRLARQLDIWWKGGTGGLSRGMAWEVPMLDDALLAAPDDPETDEWTIRIRSRPELALRVDGAERYWEGEVETDVRVRRQSRPAPPRGWVAEDAAAYDDVR